MFKLSDEDALKLAQLLVKYFADCVAIDPTTVHPGNLSVRELLEDLESSTDSQCSDGISYCLTEILDLFA